jgi:hypothetical protein
MMITKKGSAVVSPGIAEPPDFGNQSLLAMRSSQDCPMPMASPASKVTMKELKRAKSAAARAGTMRRVTV